jgi:DNA polymerase III gamma/tau subunit
MDAATALEVIEQQSDAGKDLSRLMNDVIGYIRDLLVLQTTPAASHTDVPPLEKLLVLLDQDLDLTQLLQVDLVYLQVQLEQD